MNQTIENRVIHIIAKNQKIVPETITLDRALTDVCEDSLDLVNLLFELEDEFDISIPDEAKDSETVGDIVTGIEKLLAAQKKAATEEAVH